MSRYRRGSSPGMDSVSAGRREQVSRPQDDLYYTHYAVTNLPLPEPAYIQDFAAVRPTEGAGPVPVMDVGWPGPNVELTPAGVPGPGSIMFHGFYEGPLPGRKVLIGYPNGNHANPVVLQKYPYENDIFPGSETAHVNPMTRMGVSSLDTGIGHFMGSYMMLRAGPFYPFPGGIDIMSMSRMTVTTLGGYEQLNSADWSVSAAAAGTLTTGGTLSLSAGSLVTLTSAAGGSPQPAVLGTTLNANLTSLLSILQAFFDVAKTDPIAVVTAGAAGTASTALPSVTSAISSHLSTGFLHS